MDSNGTPHPSQAGGLGSGNEKGSSAGATMGNAAGLSGQKLRKRTKTGCLTCRRRRIKCGEERPICNNCIKSKRTCEGYNQRLNWKQTIPDWGGLPEDGQALQYHDGMHAPPMGSWRPIPPPIDTAGFVTMRMPSGQPYGAAQNGEPIFSPPNSGVPFMQSMHGVPMVSPRTAYPQACTPLTPHFGQSGYGQSPMSAISTQSLPPNYAAPTQQMPMSALSQTGHHPNNEQVFQQFRRPSLPIHGLPTPTSTVQQDPSSFLPVNSVQRSPNESGQLQVAGDVCWWQPPGTSSAHQSSPLGSPWIQTGSSATALAVSSNVSDSAPIVSPTAPAPQAAKFLGHSLTGATAQFLEEAAVEVHDDMYFDVEPDEEMDGEPDQTFQQLSLMRQLHHEHMTELSMRRYDTFLYNGMLDHYNAEDVANPLNNQRTARVFAHFIFATGPSLSIFERYPRNPSAIFSESSSDHQQGLWTYTLPMMAVRDHGLLHAMLALASLHIARLQGTSSMPSYKHYAFAIKRIHRNVGIASKKLRPHTIAATLLLGFYEILTADHLKWSSHLAGAKQLLQAIPFKRMAKEARRMKAQQLAQKDQFFFHDGNHFGVSFDQNIGDLGATIDEVLVSNLMGRQVHVEQFGQVLDDDEESATSNASSHPFDLEKYELYQDLYWWYARQDVYQAILSGNRLLLDYHRWTDCPPRASMGRPEAIYGTHDHLIILFARISDFNARDRRRKIRVMEANGGHWRPPPGMNMPGPPPQSMAPPSNNPNASFMHQGTDQTHGSMPQSSNTHQPPLNYPTMNAPPFPSPQAVNPNMGYGQNHMPPAVPSFANGHGQPPFAGANSPIGTSPNFKHERGFSEASPNAPYSAQAGMPQTPSQSDFRQGSHGLPPPPPPPMFYGMAPLPTTVNLPSSYASDDPQLTPSPKSEKSDYDIEAATQNALIEWGQLKTALNTFESHLGPHFQPMPADVHPATMTPFGPALFYRSHDIGIIWAMYYMACIIVHRCHPHMPPAAMMAAGIAAPQTGHYATKIGQIIGGIAPPAMGRDLSPNLGACLCEGSLPLFFSGVQYQDPDQRQWLVTLLRNVELRTGWKSVGMVAQGCETAWEKAFEMNRGPLYKRKLDQWHVETASDTRVAKITGNYTAIDHDHPDISGNIPRDHQGTRVHWAMGILGVEEDGDEGESTHVSGVKPSRPP